jgi:hypothetical protein
MENEVEQNYVVDFEVTLLDIFSLMSKKRIEWTPILTSSITI